MTKKCVVLCEGLHDLVFLSLLLERNDVKFWRKRWREIENASASAPEITVINDFLGRRGDKYSILIKQDRDKTFCIESFWALYKTGYIGYDLKLIVDSDGGSAIEQIKREMTERLRKDVVIKSSDSVYCFKKEMKPAIFIYPGRLTDLLIEAGCGNLAGCRENMGKWELALQKYIERDESWVRELEEFLIG